MPKNHKKITQELEKIYDDKYALLKAGKSLKKKASDDIDLVFSRHPILKKLMVLAILANVGIYTLIILFAFYWKH
jgi:hypothetical protein